MAHKMAGSLVVMAADPMRLRLLLVVFMLLFTFVALLTPLGIAHACGASSSNCPCPDC